MVAVTRGDSRTATGSQNRDCQLNALLRFACDIAAAFLLQALVLIHFGGGHRVLNLTSSERVERPFSSQP